MDSSKNKKQEEIIKQVSSRFEFTKILQIILLIFFYGFFIFSVYMWYNEGRYMSGMLSYIADPFAILIGGYMIKSGIDNRSKINTNFTHKKLYKKITFSKLLMFLIIGSFIISTLFFCYAWYRLNRFPTDLFAYISKPFITILPTYLAKAILENKAISNNILLLGKITDGINSAKSYGFSTSIANMINDITDKISNNINTNVNNMNHEPIINNKIDIVEDINDIDDFDPISDEELLDADRLK